jgi:hypothetical protein
MPTRSRTSFKKRQKEILRMEKQREKAAKRMQKKTAAKDGTGLDIAQDDELLVHDPEAPEGDAPESAAPDSAAPDSANPADSTRFGTV